MRRQMRNFGGAVFVIALALLAANRSAAQAPVTDPLAIARILAAKYPAQPVMSYIPALSWSSSLRLTGMTQELQWRDKALKDIQAFVPGQTPAIAEPYRLTSFAGAQGFADAATI